MNQSFHFLFTVFFLFCLSVSPLFSEQNFPDEDTIVVASLERDWHVLLHYQSSKWNKKYKSLADGPSFFLSPDGLTNPSSELRAHLAFFQKPKEELNQMECKFPARFHWIRKRFGFPIDPTWEEHCPKWPEFKNQMRAKSVSVIFASFHPEHPASLFGHTMLKFNEEKSNGVVAEDLILNYAATIPGNIDPISFVIYGLGGGFHGSFEIQKYIYKIHEYNEFENRNLWEFKLNLNQEEVNQLTRHLWEMSQNHFDYYFLDENCSFRILTLLEVARPTLQLTEQISLMLLPTESLKVLSKQNGLIAQIQFRPSIIERYRHKYGYLTSSEKKILDQMLEGKMDSTSELDPIRRTLLFDIYIDHLVIHKIKAYGKMEIKDQELYAQAEQNRGDIQVLNSLPDYFQIDKLSNPLLSHGPSQVAMAYGNSTNGNYSEIQYRPVLRDFTDSYLGYSPYNQISFLRMNARYYEDTKQTLIQEFHVLEMTSLNPIGQKIWKPSWRLDLGMKSLHTEKNYHKPISEYYGYASGGYGVTWEPFYPFFRHQFVMFSFLDLRVDQSPVWGSGYRLGGVSSTGLLIRVYETVGLLFSGDYRSYFAGERGNFPEFVSQINWTLLENLSFEFKYRQIHSKELDWNEYQAGLKIFF
ncbi:DUF4105 domain-containing protein [Leptospira vanthielii]|uniref:DUF4105 domain-containing protein n=2 Tax=Leptospira vanthielii TaxID=293085 RepID=A0ABY2NJP5_9LEPT|nr:DUF4105 domain-containing protein [Leptospira vanthielii]EMY70122.1 PF13387 domain protein [Leptospira vanthielii serovar Holland str. Waz Holland = ATCC 700522]TGM45644.1 DUF4105 domain-containing protein [Leptospira vanthielii]